MTTMNDSTARGAISLRGGVRSYFDVDGVTIEVWGSSWSGAEEVRVDGRVVSRKRSLRRRSSHRFEIGGHRYEVRYGCESMLSGEFLIELLRDGELVDSDRLRMVAAGPDGRLSWRAILRKMAPFFLLGMLVGAAAGYVVTELVI